MAAKESSETNVITPTLTLQEQENLLEKGISEEARSALSTESSFWSGVEWFVNWIREKLKYFLFTSLSEFTIIEKWASQIGLNVVEFSSKVVGTLLYFLKTVFRSKSIWQEAHKAATTEWEANSKNDLLAETYGKKMAAYFLEIIKQCLERAIKAHGLEVSENEKKEITEALDDLLNHATFPI